MDVGEKVLIKRSEMGEQGGALMTEALPIGELVPNKLCSAISEPTISVLVARWPIMSCLGYEWP